MVDRESSIKKKNKTKTFKKITIKETDIIKALTPEEHKSLTEVVDLKHKESGGSLKDLVDILRKPKAKKSFIFDQPITNKKTTKKIITQNLLAKKKHSNITNFTNITSKSINTEKTQKSNKSKDNKFFTSENLLNLAKEDKEDKDYKLDSANLINNNNQDTENKSVFSSDDSDISSNDENITNDKIKKITCKKQSKKYTGKLANNLKLKIEENFNNIFEENYLDITYNNNEYYDVYLEGNLKVIKALNYFFNEDEFYNRLESIKDIIKKTLSNMKIPLDKAKPLLLLDLDETFFHTEQISEEEFNKKENKIQFSLVEQKESNIENYFKVNVRKYTHEFLQTVQKYFTLGVFTAGLKDYADTILEIADLDKYFEFKLYRDSCIQLKEMYIKNLDLFDGFLNKDTPILLVDNCIYSFCNNLNSGILVNSFYDDVEDEDLVDLAEYFKEDIFTTINNNQKSKESISLREELEHINKNKFLFEDIIYYL